MKTIKIKFVDFYKTADPKKDFIYRILEKHYDVIISDNPEYLIYSVFGDENLKYSHCIKIFFTGECFTPDYNLCDYAMGFDYMDFGDRYFRFPIYYPMGCGDENRIKTVRKKTVEEINVNNKGFCSYVYSNAGAIKIRREIYEKLSEYRQVDSGGRYLNNIGKPVIDKMEFQSKYKFCIAFENASYKGYTTEKLVQAFESGAVPIYWGDPSVEIVFNKKAFINCTSLKTVDEMIEKIIQVDNAPEQYKAMLQEHVFNDVAYTAQNQFNELEKWLIYIFEQPLEEAKRFSRDYYNRVYLDKRKRELKAFNKKPVNVLKKIIRSLKACYKK